MSFEGGAGGEHGAGDGEEAVGDRAQCAGVAVATSAQGGVFLAAVRVALHGDAGPVVGGIGEAVVSGMATPARFAT